MLALPLLLQAYYFLEERRPALQGRVESKGRLGLTICGHSYGDKIKQLVKSNSVAHEN
jgi:hypothetical protein